MSSTVPLPANLNAMAQSNPQVARAREQAIELEGVFLNTLVGQMFSSLDTESEFGGGYAEETWRSMQAEQIANTIARNGGIGLADQIMADLITIQEGSGNATPNPKTTNGAYSS